MHEKSVAPPLWLSLVPVFVLLILLGINVYVFRDSASAGPNQLALLLCALFAGGLGHFVLGLKYRDIEKLALHSIVLAMEAMVILLIVGALIGLWMLSGIVPTMVYYGIQFLTPNIFLFVACFICSVVSVAIGSSWSTMGTIGVALVGVGTALGFSPGLVAGAIVSGAYFGDKISPLSDTTNLAPAVAGTDLFTHVRNMLTTTVPAIVLALLAFGVLGLFHGEGSYDPAAIARLSHELQQAFNIHWYLLLVPAAVILLAALRMPAIPALAIGGLLGAAAAILFQPQQFAPGDEGSPSFVALAFLRTLTSAYDGYVSTTGYAPVDDLISRGGMLSMTNTIFLIMTAMLFGGVMESTGMLQTVARAILQLVRSASSLVTATIMTCIFFNITASEQYLAIVVPGRMYRRAYEDRGLKPRNLSRALEDGGTVTSVLVPWNTCGAYAASVLAVSTIDYAPWAIFNWLCPIIAIAFAQARIGIHYVDAVDTQAKVESTA